ncbi:NusG domain II-containing protein [Eubacterium sp. AF17-7]|uniref:NusG domain II-containing protein n=1 Tax=Eubacterium sp. AF17-7 TaxID=2293105 RepID=UPI000E47EFFA|nr:NusG domain II-containing protein [Eubacterium sp. AF17-7]RGG67151.1 NusG domain II-containing protein [Eubacterium sp. AF17-7]
MKKRDWILGAVIILVAVIMYIEMNATQSDDGMAVKITLDGKEYGTYSLDEDREIEIKTDNGNNKVEIHDKSVEMKEADCPDKYCVKQGEINKIRQNIVCLPHKIVVEIISADSSKQNEADAIAK